MFYCMHAKMTPGNLSLKPLLRMIMKERLHFLRITVG